MLAPAAVIWAVCAEALLAAIAERTLTVSHVVVGLGADALAYACMRLLGALQPYSLAWTAFSWGVGAAAAQLACGPAPALRDALLGPSAAPRRALADLCVAGALACALGTLVLTREVGEKGVRAHTALYAFHVAVWTAGVCVASRLDCAGALPPEQHAELPTCAPSREHGAPDAPRAPHPLGSLPAAAARALIGRSALMQVAQVWLRRLSRCTRAPRSPAAAPRRAAHGRCCGAPVPLSALCAAALCLYGCAVRLVAGAPAVLCSAVASEGDAACAAGRPLHAIRLADPSLLGGAHRWLYGAPAVDAPPWSAWRPRAEAASASASASASAGGGRAGAGAPSRGVVIAARGDAWKYAQPVIACVHVLRASLGSALPVEVLHVGQPEAFTPGAAALLRGYGGVSVADMLPRLRLPAGVDERTLRSFAAKPFALLAASCELCVLVDANVLFFAPPERLLARLAPAAAPEERAAAAGAEGGAAADDGGEGPAPLQLVRDYVEPFRTTDPLYVHGYLRLDADAHARALGDAECDSSVVVVDRRRAARALAVVAALNALKPATYRHMHGDKDTWWLGAALAGVRASAAGTEVGWLVRADEGGLSGGGDGGGGSGGGAPHGQSVWGHVQFVGGEAATFNWQPHYPRGHVPFDAAAGEADAAAGAELRCCAMWAEHHSGPHDMPRVPLPPRAEPSAGGAAGALPARMRETFAAARAGLALAARAERAEAGAPGGEAAGSAQPRALARASAWADVAVRTAVIYGCLWAGAALAAAARVRPAARAARAELHGWRARAGGAGGGGGAARGGAPPGARAPPAARAALLTLLLLCAAAAALLAAGGASGARVPLFLDAPLGALARAGAPLLGGAARGGGMVRAMAELEAGGGGGAAPPPLLVSTVHVTARDASAAAQQMAPWRSLGLEVRVADDAQCRRDVERAAAALAEPRLVRAYDSLPTPVLRADLWRYCIVLLEGGLYADADVVPRPRLRTALQAAGAERAAGRCELLLFVENWSFIPTRVGRAAIGLGLTDFSRFPQFRNCIFGAAAPGHPLLARAIRAALERVLAERLSAPPSNARVLELTGPGLLTDVAEGFLAERGADARVAFVDRGTGTSLFAHAGVGSWKAGAVTTGHSERWLLLGLGVALGGAGLASALSAARARARLRSKGAHSKE